jgi:alpha-tubulin suppressor-like RCC1 family protein
MQIMLNLPDLPAILNYCLTSDQASLVCQDDYFWQMKFGKDFGKISKPESITWREYYKLTSSIEPSSSISAGNTHYGIIDNQGDLHMGGSGREGKLGRGKNVLKNKNPPKLLKLRSRVICVSCNFSASGAVTETGDAYVWGYIFHDNLQQILWTPTLISLNQLALKISVSIKGYVIILNDRSVYHYISMNQKIWAGYLSNIRARDICFSGNAIVIVSENYNVYFYRIDADEPARTEIKFVEPIRHSLTDGDSHMALSISGNLYVWGSNLFGQLGQGDNIKRDQPTKVKIGAPINSMAITSSTVAITTIDGNLYMWGSPTTGKIAPKSIIKELAVYNIISGIVISSNVIMTPIELSLPSTSTDEKSTKVIEVAVGNGFTMALTKNGEIRAWGKFPTKLN